MGAVLLLARAVLPSIAYERYYRSSTALVPRKFQRVQYPERYQRGTSSGTTAPGEMGSTAAGSGTTALSSGTTAL